jgi:undecaprenyl-diphosphatase
MRVFLMEQFNHLLFSLINATPDSPSWAIGLGVFIAKDSIVILPVVTICLWLWGHTAQMGYQRTLVAKTAIALAFAMAMAKTLSMLFPHARPFAEGFGYNFLPHAPDDSFPSDHATAAFSFAIAFLCWFRLLPGALIMLLALAIAWSRIYLGVHWPLDMLGGFLVAGVGCLFSQLLWNLFGEAIAACFNRAYQLLFAWPIRKGWVQR